MSQIMPSVKDEPQKDYALKRKAWVAVFIVSGLFWFIVAASAWHFWG